MALQSLNPPSHLSQAEAMESKYDRVAYPENVYLHSDGEMEGFGTGVYPVSVISRKPFHDDTINLGCFKVRRKYSTLLMISAVILILLVITIGVGIHAAVSHQEQQEADAGLCRSGTDPTKKSFGLSVQPMIPGSGSTICFDATDYKTYQPYLNSLEYHTSDYSAVPQSGSTHVNCTADVAPVGKQCFFDIHKFGPLCTSSQQFGYNQARPCVLLVLQMPKHIVPKPFEENDPITKTKLQNGVWSPDHVAVTCEGATNEDKKHMGNFNYTGPNHLFEGPIFISPKKGFPINFYKGGNTVVPGVMVSFGDLHITRTIPITIKCVAWAKNFNNGQPQTSIVYTTKFKFILS